MIVGRWSATWLVGALVVLAGCSPSGALRPNLAPETTVFIQGPVDTVSYRVELHWFGSDVDGYVTAYDIRFLNPEQPADTQWVRTTVSDSVFRVFTPHGTSRPVFEVRAVDDHGAVDATPARETFSFRNLPPLVRIVSGPRSTDTTFASVTISWAAVDPDGDIAHATYRVWLDGREANADVATGTTFTVPSAQFLVNGAYTTGRRTVYVQAIDEAGYATAPESLSWIVRAPVTGSRARLLIVDDEPGNSGPQFRQDTLYVNTAARNLPPGTFSILRLEFTQPFRSSKDLEQTLELFDAVVWYRGSNSTVQPVLANYQDAVGHYLESGGQFFIESQTLVTGRNAPGIFPPDWVDRYLGSDALITHPTPIVGDSSASWGIGTTDLSGNPVVLRSDLFSDSLLVTLGGYSELRAFAVRNPGHAMIWADPAGLTQNNLARVPIAVSVPQPGGGRLVAVTMPLRSANGYGTVPRILAHVFAQLGLTGP